MFDLGFVAIVDVTGLFVVGAFGLSNDVEGVCDVDAVEVLLATHFNLPKTFWQTHGCKTVPDNVPAFEQIPPGAFTHSILFPIFSHTNGVASVPDFNPIFAHLPPTEAEGCCANVGVENSTTSSSEIKIALTEVLKSLHQDYVSLFANTTQQYNSNRKKLFKLHCFRIFV